MVYLAVQITTSDRQQPKKSRKSNTNYAHLIQRSPVSVRPGGCGEMEGPHGGQKAKPRYPVPTAMWLCELGFDTGPLETSYTNLNPDPQTTAGLLSPPSLGTLGWHLLHIGIHSTFTDLISCIRVQTNRSLFFFFFFWQRGASFSFMLHYWKRSLAYKDPFEPCSAIVTVCWLSLAPMCAADSPWWYKYTVCGEVMKESQKLQLKYLCVCVCVWACVYLTVCAE